jgi:formate hydrogenlyase subunit 4
VNPFLSMLLAVLVFPGVLVAFLAAWLLTWVRGATFGAVGGGGIRNPLGELGELRVAFEREAIPPEGVHPVAVTLATAIALLCPLLALILLPVPGNPLAASLGLPGDLVAVGALLLGVPLSRLFLGWAIPSPHTRLAADRQARLLSGAVLPMILALTATAEQVSSLQLLPETAKSPLPLFTLVSRLLVAAAFACAMPVLAHRSALREGDGAAETLESEVAELSGQDLVYFRIGEALQLVAVSGLFVAAFILPLLRQVPEGGGRTLVWIVGTVLTAAGIGLWDAISGKLRAGEERPPLSWWLGLPLLLSLAALVATAWATRG